MSEEINYFLKLPLMKHQVDAVNKCLSMRDGGFLNRSEPGTGKTLATIASLNRLAAQGKIAKVLVVCPNSVKQVWAREFNDMNHWGWDVKVLDKSAKERMKTMTLMKGATQVLITNYESIVTLLQSIVTWAPDVIVLDEAHYIKGHRTQRTKAIKKIKAKYRWALTGTPMVQNPLDIWSIIDWTSPGTFSPSFYAFRNRYAIIYSGAGFPMIKGFKNLEEISDKLKAVSHQSLKSECLDLPEKQWIVRDVELSANELNAYRRMAQDMLIEVGDREVTASTALVKLLRLQQITGGFVPGVEDGDIGVDIGHSKVESLLELLDELDGQKVVIWCKFKDEVRKVSEALKKAKIMHVVMTGETCNADRIDAINSFQRSDGKVQCFVGTIQTGGIGITLTAASYMIYYSNSWSLADRIQSSDRIHRIGQTNRCTYYDLIVKGTVDARVHKVLNGKAALASSLSGQDLKNIMFDVD